MRLREGAEDLEREVEIFVGVRRHVARAHEAHRRARRDDRIDEEAAVINLAGKRNVSTSSPTRIGMIGVFDPMVS